MNYQSYLKIQQDYDYQELRKRPGQKFCDEVGSKIVMHNYKEIRRPDKITFIGGTLYRTYKPVYDVWYNNIHTNEHVLVEFNEDLSGTIKRHVKVSESKGARTNTITLHIDSECYSDLIHFNTNNEAANCLIRIARR